MKNIEEGLYQVLNSVFNSDVKINKDNYKELNLHLDSLQTIRFLIEIESYFDIELPDDLDRNILFEYHELVNVIEKCNNEELII